MKRDPYREAYERLRSITLELLTHSVPTLSDIQWAAYNGEIDQINARLEGFHAGQREARRRQRTA